ncbi:hypothetical protein NC652_039338 [Populus alba x Populus x berolinensis]|nr:hypothetical protein NC652_039338 [Populus alba x Populus x berolinensis]
MGFLMTSLLAYHSEDEDLGSQISLMEYSGCSIGIESEDILDFLFQNMDSCKLTVNRNKDFVEGSICNGTQAIGWHVNESSRRFQRFEAGMSGFAFNSIIIWDPKRWHRPTPEPVRQLEIVKDGFQVCTFIEQVVEDESQMEGLSEDCSGVMAWHLQLQFHIPGSISLPIDITRASDMVPNLDLILLAFLYGCFIACVVGAIIFAILNALLLAFSITLFSIAIIDLQDLFSFVSRFAVPLKENLELGFALLVCTAMYYAIGAMMASKPVFERMVSEFKVKARHVLSHLEVLATSC